MNQRIIQALEAGDPRSLEWIFEAYGHDCIQRLQQYEGCSPPDAEDIFMDSLMVLWHRAQQGKVLTLSRNYLYTMCVNEQRHRYRAQQRAQRARAEVQHQLYDLPYELPRTEQADQEEARRELAKAAQQALEQLGERCQQVMRCFYEEKLSLTEVARRLGLANTGVAKTLRYRCHQRWLKELRKIKKKD